MAPMSSLNSPNFFCLHIYSLWIVYTAYVTAWKVIDKTSRPCGSEEGTTAGRARGSLFYCSSSARYIVTIQKFFFFSLFRYSLIQTSGFNGQRRDCLTGDQASGDFLVFVGLIHSGLVAGESYLALSVISASQGDVNGLFPQQKFLFSFGTEPRRCYINIEPITRVMYLWIIVLFTHI